MSHNDGWSRFNDQFRETDDERRDRLRKSRQRQQEAAMGPDHSREGIFVYHNCHRCDHGKKPCIQGGSHRCEYPHARND